MVETARAIAETLRYCHAVSRRLSLTDDSVDYSGGQMYDVFADFVFPQDVETVADNAIKLTVIPSGGEASPSIKRADRAVADWLATLLTETPHRFRPSDGHPVEIRLARLFAPYVLLRASDCLEAVTTNEKDRLDACRDIASALTSEIARDLYPQHYRSREDPVYPFAAWTKVAAWVIVLVLRKARIGRGLQTNVAADAEMARLNVRTPTIMQGLDSWVSEQPYSTRDPRIMLTETTNDLMRERAFEADLGGPVLPIQPDELSLFFDLCVAPGLVGSLARTTLASMG